MSKSVIELEKIRKSFGNHTVLKSIDLVLEEGDYVALLGFSGSGKTTLLNILGLLDEQFEGHYFICGENVKMAKHKANLRNEKIGYVFQSFYLIDYLSVLDNILLPFSYCKEAPDMEYINQIIHKLDLDDLMDKKVNVLSGGEKQRIAIARALSKKPALLLCDEPTGNLDSRNRERVLSILKDVNLSTKTCILIVTHDEFVAKSADKRYVLENGVLYEK